MNNLNCGENQNYFPLTYLKINSIKKQIKSKLSKKKVENKKQKENYSTL